MKFSYVKRFFSGTLLSRLSGMLRDLTMACAFGDHPSIAAFMVAFRFANVFRRLLGEGPFQSALIPQLEEIRLQSPQNASYFFQRLTVLSVLFLIVLIGVLEGFMGISSSHLNLSEGNREILHLTMWMLPGLLFICLYGLNLSLLNCHNSFFVPSVAPFVCNSIWIIGAFLLRNTHPMQAAQTLAQLIAIGFFGQWLLTLPLVHKYSSFSIKNLFHLHIPQEVKTLIKSFALGAIGVGAEQINACIDSLCARYSSAEGPVYLWYSIRLEQFILALFGIACVSTVIPELSRAIKAQDKALAHTCFAKCFQRILLVMIPATFAVFILGAPGVNLLYGRGNFSETAVLQTTFCLWAYSLSLIPTTMVILFSSIFYAEKDFKTPTLISLSTVLINLFLNSTCVFYLGLGAISTAFSTSTCSWINWWIMHTIAKKRGWNSGYTYKKTWLFLGIGACATLTSLICGGFLPFLMLSRNWVEQVVTFLSFFLGFFICIGVFFLRASGNVDNPPLSQDKNIRS